MKLKNSTYIIAEIGSNHNGKLELAKDHIIQAKKSGANAVKFQVFKSKYFFKKNTKNYRYIKKFEFKLKWINQIEKLCKKLNIDFILSFFDSSDLKPEIIKKIDAIKIASSEVINHDLIIKSAKTNKPIILSTGMSNLSEIYEAIELIEYNGNNKISILQCSSIYPSLDNELNLNVIETYKKIFSYKVGFSDHSKSIISALVAVSKGARIIEKHFTIDNSLDGPDHFYALNPTQFKEMSLTIKRVNKMLGSHDKKPLKNELKFCRRNSIYLNKNMKKISKIKPQNFTIKQPQIGIPSKYLNKLGKMKLKRNLKSGSVLKWEDIF
jgi:sialic acid synthase SpsE